MKLHRCECMGMDASAVLEHIDPFECMLLHA